MKRFQSRFFKLRRIREQQERLTKADAAARNSELEQASKVVSDREEQLRQVRTTMTNLMDQGVSGGVLSALLSSVSHHELRLKTAFSERQKAAETADAAMKIWQTARTELKTVEEMIHRERQEHEVVQRKHEDNQLQEQASRSWFRRSIDREHTVSGSDADADSHQKSESEETSEQLNHDPVMVSVSEETV
jgi:flagellar export protein FliJ